MRWTQIARVGNLVTRKGPPAVVFALGAIAAAALLAVASNSIGVQRSQPIPPEQSPTELPGRAPTFVVSQPLAQGAFRLFMQVDGIPGSSTDPRHRGEFEILSYECPCVDMNAEGKRSFRDLAATKRLDDASAALFRAADTGDLLGDARLVVEETVGDRHVFATYEFAGSKISTYRVQGDPRTDALPVEAFTLSFERVFVTFTSENLDGDSGTPRRARVTV